MPPSFSAYSSACTAPRTSKERGWAWPPSNASCRSTEAKSGPKLNWTKGLRSTSRWPSRPQHMYQRRRPLMNLPETDILLVEDNKEDIELTLHALRRERLANRIHVARDGVEALDFIFCTGPFADRSGASAPRLVL